MIKLLIALILSTLIFGCSSAEKKAAVTAEEAYSKAQEYEKDGNSLEAIEKYNEVRNKFPYSKLATEAKLAIADIHFKDEDFADAQAEYALFKDLHPKHPKIDYATYQLGLSYFNQLPDSIDRDLSIANDAIPAFNEVLNKFPTSTYAKLAQEKKLECLKKLAEKESYIAHFYFIRSKWDSALKRYEGLLAQDKALGFEEISLARSAISANRLGLKDKENNFLSQLKKYYPKSSEIEKSETEIK